MTRCRFKGEDMITEELIKACTSAIEKDGETARVALSVVKTKEPSTDVVTLFPYGVAKGGPKGAVIRTEEWHGSNSPMHKVKVWAMFNAKEVLDFLNSH